MTQDRSWVLFSLFFRLVMHFFCQGISTGSQQDASPQGATNQMREVLADEMLDRYQQFS